MANLNKENIITVDVKNATVKTEGSMSFYVTDIKTCNIYCQLVINESKSTLVKNYAPIENAEDFSITLRLIKPNNEPKELSFSLLNQVEAFFYVDLTDEYKDCIGTYNCELFVDCLVNGELERITTSSFTYRVNASIMNKLDDVIDNMQSNPLIEALATKEYVDNIVYVIDKTEAEEGITYEDFKNGGCTCKLSGSLYFGDTYFTFDDELVYVVKTDYSNMKKLYVYRITTVARPGGGATADYIILDYKEGTYEAYNYMLEEIEHKADQVKLDLLNIIDDANYAPVTYVNDSMKTVNDTTREYVNNCIEDITDNINTAGYTTESYVDDKVLALRTDFASNFAPLSYVNEKLLQINTSLMYDYATTTYVDNKFSYLNSQLIDIKSKEYATKESVDEVSSDLSKLKSDTLDYLDDHWQNIEWIKEDWAKKEYVNEQISKAAMGDIDLTGYATIEYVETAISNISPGGGSGDCNCDLSQYVDRETFNNHISDCVTIWELLDMQYVTSDYLMSQGYITDMQLMTYATHEDVANAIANIEVSGGGGNNNSILTIGNGSEEHIFSYDDIPDSMIADDPESFTLLTVLLKNVTFNYMDPYNNYEQSSKNYPDNIVTVVAMKQDGAKVVIVAEFSAINGSREMMMFVVSQEGVVLAEQFADELATTNNVAAIYATKTELNNKADKTHTHTEYLTEHQDLSNYATKNYVHLYLGDIETLLGEI